MGSTLDGRASPGRGPAPRLGRTPLLEAALTNFDNMVGRSPPARCLVGNEGMSYRDS